MVVSPFLEEDLRAKIKPGITLVIDMARTSFVDPSIASVFAEGVTQCRRQGAKFMLKGVNANVQQILESAGLLQYFRQI